MIGLQITMEGRIRLEKNSTKTIGRGIGTPNAEQMKMRLNLLPKIAVGAGYTNDIYSLNSFHLNNDIAIGCREAYAKFLHCIKAGNCTPIKAFN